MIEEIVLHGDELFQQCRVVLLLREKVIAQLDAVFNYSLIRVRPGGILVIQQALELVSFRCETADHKDDQCILI